MLAQGSGQKSQHRRAPRRTFTRPLLRRQQPKHPPRRLLLQNPNETRGLADPTRVIGSQELKHKLFCNAANFAYHHMAYMYDALKPLRFQVPGFCGPALYQHIFVAGCG